MLLIKVKKLQLNENSLCLVSGDKLRQIHKIKYTYSVYCPSMVQKTFPSEIHDLRKPYESVDQLLGFPKKKL